MTVLMFMMAIAALLRLVPDLPLARIVHEWLARRPAAWLLRRTRRELIVWSIVAGLCMFGGEYVLVLGGPQAALMFAADLAAYIDALVAVAALASVARGRAVAQWFALRRIRRLSSRARRSRRGAVLKPPANDDEGRPRAIAA